MVASITAKTIDPIVDSLRSWLVIISFFIDFEKFIEYKERGDGVHIGTRLQITTRLISAKVDFYAGFGQFQLNIHDILRLDLTDRYSFLYNVDK